MEFPAPRDQQVLAYRSMIRAEGFARHRLLVAYPIRHVTLQPSQEGLPRTTSKVEPLLSNLNDPCKSILSLWQARLLPFPDIHQAGEFEIQLFG